MQSFLSSLTDVKCVHRTDHCKGDICAEASIRAHLTKYLVCAACYLLSAVDAVATELVTHGSEKFGSKINLAFL